MSISSTSPHLRRLVRVLLLLFWLWAAPASPERRSRRRQTNAPGFDAERHKARWSRAARSRWDDGATPSKSARLRPRGRRSQQR